MPTFGILLTVIDLKPLFFIFLNILYKLLAASFKLPFLLRLKRFFLALNLIPNPITASFFFGILLLNLIGMPGE